MRLLTDPILRDRLLHLRRRSLSPAPAVSEDLAAVLISHLHLDHLDRPSLRKLDPGLRLIVPRGGGGMLRKAGFARVEELAPGESAWVEDVEVVATPAVHDGGRRPFGGPRVEPLGFVLRRGRSVYFAGDTDLFEGMAELEPDLDVALLPVWGWGPKLGPGHLDPERAARAAAMLSPRLAVPIHWGTFYPRILRPRGRLTDPPHEFAARAAEWAPTVEVRVLEPGESLRLGA